MTTLAADGEVTEANLRHSEHGNSIANKKRKSFTAPEVVENATSEEVRL